MNNKLSNITYLSIIGVVLIILIVLWATGHLTNDKEEFLSKIKDYFTGSETPQTLLDTHSQHEKAVIHDKAPFPPDKMDDITDIPSPIRDIENPDNNYSISDLNKHFTPKSTSGQPEQHQQSVQSSSKHQNINQQPDGMLKPTGENKDVIINSNGGKAGPHSPEKSTDLYNIIGGDSFKFFDANFVPDAKQYVYTGAEIGVESDVPLNFKCHGGKEEVQAEAVAKINDSGEVSEIIVLHKGTGYKKAKVKIEGGGGNGCKAKAIIDDNSSISHIEVENGGKNYISTPHITISKPNQNKTCKLFYKKNK